MSLSRGRTNIRLPAACNDSGPGSASIVLIQLPCVCTLELQQERLFLARLVALHPISIGGQADEECTAKPHTANLCRSYSGSRSSASSGIQDPLQPVPLGAQVTSARCVPQHPLAGFCGVRGGFRTAAAIWEEGLLQKCNLHRHDVTSQVNE